MTAGNEAETGWGESWMGYRGVSRTGGWAQGVWDAELRALPRVVDKENSTLGMSLLLPSGSPSLQDSQGLVGTAG
jgi:hypothetical protein